VEHGFDVVPVRVEDIGGVVAGVVLRPDARHAVVAGAGRERNVVEAIDGLSALGLERDVRTSDRVAAPNAEVEAVLVRVVRDGARLLVDDALPEEVEHLVVEAARPLPLPRVDGNVRDGHCGVWQTASMLFPSASRTNAA
jgi:hypothetical protein